MHCKISTTWSRLRLAVLSSTLLLVVSSAFAFPIRMGLSPDNNLNLLLSVLNSARQELIINIYQFESPEIATAVIDRINAGVNVELLVEAEPFGQMSAQGKETLTIVSRAMRAKGNPRNHLFVMKKPASENARRRFRWNHAKYIIADQHLSLISSENFSRNGHPISGQVGNRGWDITMNDAKVAADLRTIFDADSDRKFGDVVELSGKEPAAETPLSSPSPSRARKVAAIPIGRGDAKNAELILSPRSLDGIVQLIRSARKNLEMEEMSLPAKWRSPHIAENPIVTELIRAAQRGVEVRVLLNDDKVWSQPDPSPIRLGRTETPPAAAPKKGNEATVELLRTVATSERLPLSAKIIDVQAAEITYIHNKGILVDGQLALVGSINGTQNSVVNNREVAILLESPDAAEYFGAAFDFDWGRSNLEKHEMNSLFMVVGKFPAIVDQFVD